MSDYASIIAEAWRLFPHTFAEKVSQGKWHPYKHLKYLSQAILPGLTKGNGRYIVTLPPRHGKSEYISHWVPAWYLETFPDRRIALGSYAAKFASKWGRKVRTTLESTDLVDVVIREDSRAADRFDTDQGGGMITAGVGGPMTGEGAHLLVIDDPIKNWQEASSELRRQVIRDWFDSVAYTRLEPGATIIILMTRWHEADLVGHLLTNHKDNWTLINFPAMAEVNDPLNRSLDAALCPERYNEKDLERIKNAVGAQVWNALYQQRPTAQEGGAIKRQWFKYWKVLPSELIDHSQSWDLSFTGSSQSDFCTGQVWARSRSKADKYLIDQVRFRGDFNEQVAAIRTFSKKHPKAIEKLIEEKANGAALIAMLRREIPGMIPFNPKTSKEQRVMSVVPEIEAGNVYLPDPSIAPWVHDFVEECAGFPNAANDDQVDAMTQRLIRWQSQNSGDFNNSFLQSNQKQIAIGLKSGDQW